jgi:hypothetical protein
LLEVSANGDKNGYTKVDARRTEQISPVVSYLRRSPLSSFRSVRGAIRARKRARHYLAASSPANLFRARSFYLSDSPSPQLLNHLVTSKITETLHSTREAIADNQYKKAELQGPAFVVLSDRACFGSQAPPKHWRQQGTFPD